MIKKDIDKLPSDVRAQYKRFKVMHAEKKIQRKATDDFMSFTKAVWPEFKEGAHHRVDRKSDVKGSS